LQVGLCRGFWNEMTRVLFPSQVICKLLRGTLLSAPTADQYLTSGLLHDNRGKTLVFGTHCALELCADWLSLSNDSNPYCPATR
jgi:hypothetical protein